MTANAPRLNRRAFLAGAAAAGIAPAYANTGPDPLAITARPGTAWLQGPDHPATPIWGFGGSAPGPVLRLKQGEELAVDFANQLPEASAIHWHGIRIINAMDGVPRLTQPPVEPGGTFRYRFTPPDAGTFWYHPHERSFEQVPRGLTGALIIEERNPPEVDQDLVLLINDWRLDGEGKLLETFGSRHDQAHAGRLGNFITINGQPFATLPVRRNERIRLRVINACSARVITLLLEGAAPKLIAIDGQPVGPTTSYGDALTLGPANRVDLVLDITEARPAPLVAPIALEPNARLAEPDRTDALLVPLVMTGGAASETDMSVLAGTAPVWQFNGMASMHMLMDAGTPGDPLFRVRKGRSVHVRFDNQTAWPHAMHIHGHHFRLLARQNGPAPQPFWWDTLLVQPGETSLIGFVADNPGKWMLHCHMLDHQASGMDSWFEVMA
jgi:FtsP/CotA-like multicopper oxidase with cupredoxin domain